MKPNSHLVWAFLSVVAAGVMGCPTTSYVHTDPRVTLSAEPRTGLAPLDVAFVAFIEGGEGVLSFTWDFDDGETRSGIDVGPNVSHTYAFGGTYSVRVTVVDSDEHTATATIDVAVGTDSDPAIAVIATPDTGPAPLAVHFECAATGGNAPLRFHWDFGDGTDAEGAFAAHTYLAHGTYVATCSVVDADGSAASDTQPITVGLDGMPVAMASAELDGRYVPLEVAFHGEAMGGDGALRFEWRFGDGETGLGADVTHTYDAAGIYRVALLVTDEDGDVGMDMLTIEATTPPTVNAPPTAVAEILAGACAIPAHAGIPGTMVLLDAGGSADPEGDPLSFEWRFVRLPVASSAVFSSPSVENPGFFPDVEGEYEIRVFVDDGTSRVASDVVTVHASGPAVVSPISGADQTAAAAEPFAAPLRVRVLNDCGAPIAGLPLTVRARNATASGPVTDAAGETALRATAGTRAGTAEVRVEARPFDATRPPLTAVFPLTVTAGPAARLTVDAAPPADVADETGLPLTIRVTDRFGNFVPTGSATFTLCSDTPNVVFGIETVCTELTTSGGIARTTLWAGEAGEARLVMTRCTPSSYGFGGWAASRLVDLEREPDGWTTGGTTAALESEWAWGTPLGGGPAACRSGTGCYGTNLLGNYTPGSPSGDESWVEGRLDTWMLPHRPLYVELAEHEYLDVPTPDRTAYGCGGDDGGLAAVRASVTGWDWLTLTPVDGFDVYGCTFPGGRGGATAGWVETVYWLSDPYAWATNSARVRWVLHRGASPVTGAGFYVDDVLVRAYFEGETWVRFTGACDNGEDDDEDGIVDYPFDPGCASALDADETDPTTRPACANGIDDDGDRAVDYPADRDCAAASDESEAPSCHNGLDDDGDGWIDEADIECVGPFPERDEGGLPYDLECTDMIDNDHDGAIDGNDPQCTSWDASEAAPPVDLCTDRLDNDRDGWLDGEDPDCALGPVPGERGLEPAFGCNDALDNDGDGLFDRADPDCATARDLETTPPLVGCANGLDDDGDGWMDGSDPDCLLGPEETGFGPFECNDGVDNDGVGDVDAADPDCHGATSFE